MQRPAQGAARRPRLWATRPPGGVQQTIELEELYEDETEAGGRRSR